MADPATPWTRFTHIGVMTRDIDATIAHYVAMGAGPFKKFELPGPGGFRLKYRQHFGKAIDDNLELVAWGQFGDIAVELFQNIRGEGLQSHFLKTRGVGVWHYGYDVDDMEAVIAFMAARGFPVCGDSAYEDGTRMCYFDTFDAYGVYWQGHQVAPGSDLKKHLEG